MSTRVIIFSRDRAMQLDALISSLKANVVDYALNEPPHIIWAASNDAFGQGYAHCMADHPDARFIHEHDFAADYRALIHDAEHIVHFTDDSILHRRINLGHAEWELAQDDRVLAFCLRMGVNCVRCFPHDCAQRLPIFGYRNPPLLMWTWPGCELDWSYSASVDGNVFRGDDLRRLLDGATFDNPNTLEDAMAQRVHRLAAERPRLAAYRHSVLTCVPVNRVQDGYPNRTIANGWSAAALNGAYLDGARIAWWDMDWARVDAAHCDVPLRFVGGEVAAA